MLPALRHHDEDFAAEPNFDTAVSRAILQRVAAGALPETLRLHRPGDVVAFSPLDATRPGFSDAVAAARAVGFGAVRRLAGGHAAVFTEGTLAFAWCLPADDPRLGIRERFDLLATIVVEALAGLGVDARIGAVPGEYCPGDHSVNARGKRKLMGVGQRIVRGAAHVGGVIVLRGSERVREALLPVYRALELEWDPESAGSLEDEIGPVDEAAVRRALLAAFEHRRRIEAAPIDAETLALARALAPDHEPLAARARAKVGS